LEMISEAHSNRPEKGNGADIFRNLRLITDHDSR
jgi:hypothetical protein